MKVVSDTAIMGTNREATKVLRMASEGWGVADIAYETGLTVRQVNGLLERGVDLLSGDVDKRRELLITISNANLDRVSRSLHAALDRIDAADGKADKELPGIAKTLVAVVEARIKLNGLSLDADTAFLAGRSLNDLPWGLLSKAEMSAIATGQSTIAAVFKPHINKKANEDHLAELEAELEAGLEASE